jgi:hypothetical protein
LLFLIAQRDSADSLADLDQVAVVAGHGVRFED